MYKLLLGKSSKKFIYTFNTFTFTNAGKTGNTGPSLTQCRNTYRTDWSQETAFFNVISGIQYWTVPVDGLYRITAVGASGGGRNGGNGKGASISGSVELVAGTKLKILVGQMGTIAKNYDCSGGGGTFVSTIDNQPLFVAGGGGGGSSSLYPNGNASLTIRGHDGMSGHTSSGFALGGSNGNGGSYGSSTGQGGSGFYGNSPAYDNRSTVIPQSFINGGLGGINNYGGGSGAVGGFGGGGGSNRGLSWGALSGGGGYSGGGASYIIGNNATMGLGAGGGGGSYNIGLDKDNRIRTTTGHGYVEIRFLG